MSFKNRLLDFAAHRLQRRLAPQAGISAEPAESTKDVQHKIEENGPLRLHIGGLEPKEGWKILNINTGPQVDFHGDIHDLSQFQTNSILEIYASHVLEHVGQGAAPEVFHSLHRVLQPGGRLMISVPDLEVLCALYLEAAEKPGQRHHVMRMMFGGQTDAYDFHYIGYDFHFLSSLLTAAGFSTVQRVENFGLFSDTSSYVCYGRAISLNLIATKP